MFKSRSILTLALVFVCSSVFAQRMNSYEVTITNGSSVLVWTLLLKQLNPCE
ncbi:MAG: hypothetical protein ACI9NT_001389 [Bacteroidia bacterium]|jgi:hypothetical protein